MSSPIQNSNNSNTNTTSTSTNNSDDDKDSVPSLWKVISLSQHLHTVGIGEVFLLPPPNTMLYDNLLSNNSQSIDQPMQLPIHTWEIVGDIKTIPEDFIVREIGGVKKKAIQNNNQQSQAKLAVLNDCETLPPNPFLTLENNNDCQNNFNHHEEETINTNISNEGDGDQQCQQKEEDSTTTTTINTNSNSEVKSNSDITLTEIASSPKDAVYQILTKCLDLSHNEELLLLDNKNIYTNANTIEYKDGISAYGKNLFERIENLHNQAEQDISDTVQHHELKDSPSHHRNHDNKHNHQNNENKDDFIIIPPITDKYVIISLFNSNTHNVPLPKSSSINTNQNNSKNRTLFHKMLKIAYPLLQTITLNNEQQQSEPTTNSTYEKCNLASGKLIKVEKDVSFHGLIPYLSNPIHDLVQLYTFRNKGCILQDNKQSNSNNNKRKLYNTKNNRNKHATTTGSSDNDETVLLHLQSSITKEQRRDIHFLITNACHGLETSFKIVTTSPSSDNTLQNKNNDRNTDTITTISAISVNWSSRAKAIEFKKRKRESIENQQLSNLSPDTRFQTEFPHTLCIVKKRQQEHLNAINNLVQSINCREGDIGIGGIKDMCAITYQFCTIRNVGPRRVRKANDVLREKGMEVGNFQRVNYLLNLGDLEGNQFEVVVRNLKRIMIQRKERSSTTTGTMEWEESMVPCDSSHLDRMVERVRSHGFINFYGEQRVGIPGSKEMVGVRSFDIGREMLKGNFDNVINLIMTGRLYKSNDEEDYIETPEIRNVRDVWASSGGDVEMTIKALPLNSNVLVRERTILRGLNRFGKSNPLAALRGLNHNIRMFWINAYQSYVWNMMATERIKRLGLKPVIGDLYRTESSTSPICVVEDPSVVKINQVVLPLPGWNVKYPENIIGDLYKEFLSRDGIEFQKDSIPESTAKGNYRDLVCVTNDLEWERVESTGDESQSSQCKTSDNDIIQTARFKFSIKSGSYATMLLRELMVNTVAR